MTPRPVPRPEAASAPELQCVITVSGPAGSAASSASAPWRASAALAASSSRWIASASSRARSGPAAATRSTAQERLRAVGRAPASTAAARSSPLGSRATSIASP